MKKPLSLFLAIVVVLATIPFVGVANAMTPVQLTSDDLARTDITKLGNTTIFYGLGALISAAGIVVGKKRRN